MKLVAFALWITLRTIWRVSTSSSPIGGGISVYYGFTLLSTPSELSSSTSFSVCRGVKRGAKDNKHGSTFYGDISKGSGTKGRHMAIASTLLLFLGKGNMRADDYLSSESIRLCSIYVI
jgi:hypothetical protein